MKTVVKCYPVSCGNVSICPNNTQSHCNHFNKKCNNTQGVVKIKAIQKMSPAEKYREELVESIYMMHYLGEDNDWEYEIECEELDRVGPFIPKETK